MGLFKPFRYIAICMAAALMGGCISFDYVGQKLAPLEGGQVVAFYDSADQVPAGQYRVIGRAVAVGPDGTTSQEVRQKLIDKAREYGADAIQVVSFKRIRTGTTVVAKNDQYSGAVGSWVQTSNRADATPLYNDTFSQNIPLQTVAIAKFETRAKVLFLVNIKKYDTAMEQFKKSRARYLHEESRFAK
ncbi:MAG: hypothetical protein GY750_07875 [Lentisphaerae bacterium]|nr:hypothetical protein [Lentisphaerota bacterium]MCP4101325.1 hypothetical protein [Lentisphaerota bacterium]